MITERITGLNTTRGACTTEAHSLVQWRESLGDVSLFPLNLLLCLRDKYMSGPETTISRC